MKLSAFAVVAEVGSLNRRRCHAPNEIEAGWCIAPFRGKFIEFLHQRGRLYDNASK